MMRNSLTRTIWLVTVAIMIMGLVALYSASYQNPRVDQKIFYDQLIFALLGLFIMAVVSNIDYRRFYDASYLLYGMTVILLVTVLILGRHVLGAKRWIEFGSFNFQPSEMAKLAVILALARYFSREKSSPYGASAVFVLWRGLIVPLLILGIPTLLIFKQPDLGTALLIFFTFLIMLFTSGLRYGYFFSFLASIAAIFPFAWHVLKPYQKDRLLVFLNPNIDPLGAGYTIIQSRISVGSGQFFGKGWLSGTQNQLNFLPERHTDFIFSVIGEEWGLLGTLLLTFCFFILIDRCFRIAGQTKNKFGLYAATGFISILSLQAIINIGMVIGLCPVVGVTLPFVSYGRSSFIVSVIMLGILLNLYKKRLMY